MALTGFSHGGIAKVLDATVRPGTSGKSSKAHCGRTAEEIPGLLC